MRDIFVEINRGILRILSVCRRRRLALKSGIQLRFACTCLNLGQNVPRHPRSRTTRTCRRIKCRLISLPLNFSGSGEIIRQLARPCSNTYIHRSSRRRLLPGGRGLFKLKSRQDLNFKISIWLANLSASFRPRERTTALPPSPRRGQIARVRHQKSFTSRALFFLPCLS